MVWRYKRKRQVTYSQKHLLAAIQAVQQGVSIREASVAHGVPRQTIHNHISEKQSGKVGHKTVLTSTEEEMIVVALRYCAEHGWPCNRTDLRQIVRDFCDDVNRSVPWGTDGPGKDFLQGFERRWAHELQQRKPEILTAAAAKSLNASIVKHFLTT
jgi:hypothetical protein